MRALATHRLSVVSCGIFGIYKHGGSAAVEIYEGLLMLQHRGQDSAGIVCYDGQRFRERKVRVSPCTAPLSVDVTDSTASGRPAPAQHRTTAL